MKITCSARYCLLLILILFSTDSANAAARYDLIIQNGMIYDGLGGKPYRADLAMKGDKIAAIGQLSANDARKSIDVHGLAVAPGFINMLSWAGRPMLVDGRSQSDIRQGVTLEVMGEGISAGPLNRTMRK